MYIPFVKLKRIIGVESNTSIDPVCKVSVDEMTAKLRGEHKGKTFYFCGPDAGRHLKKRQRNILSR
jgi:YHS domain-containing protein